jgi:predicted nuclease of predicted toxin-antitoxin system
MQFLVDINLPKYFSFFNSPNFKFVEDIDLTLSDTKIWEFAISQNLVILTKDTDFYNRSILASKKPKVVFLKLGNTTLKQLHQYFRQNWEVIQEAIQENYLVVATQDSIDIIL